MRDYTTTHKKNLNADDGLRPLLPGDEPSARITGYSYDPVVNRVFITLAVGKRARRAEIALTPTFAGNVMFDILDDECEGIPRAELAEIISPLVEEAFMRIRIGAHDGIMRALGILSGVPHAIEK